MAKYACIRNCFLSLDGLKARLYKSGEVYEFKKEPPDKFFACIKASPDEIRAGTRSVAKEVLDLERASEDELLESDITVKALRTYAEDAYGVKLKGTSREDVVKSFVDARYRHLEGHEAEGLM